MPRRVILLATLALVGPGLASCASVTPASSERDASVSASPTATPATPPAEDGDATADPGARSADPAEPAAPDEPAEPTDPAEPAPDDVGSGDDARPAGAEPRVAPACDAASLSTSLSRTSSGADGTSYLLAFTNSSSAICAVAGSPRLAWVGDAGAEVGDATPADRDGEPVALAPGEAATAKLDIVAAGSDDCRTVDVAGVRVSARAEDAGVTLPVDVDELCADDAPELVVGALS